MSVSFIAEPKLINTSSILQMASYKVAVFILVVAVLSRTAFSDCLNDCDNIADNCIKNCQVHSCGAGCSEKLTKCYGKCGVETKREYYSSLPKEPDHKPNDEGFMTYFISNLVRIKPIAR